MHWYPMYQKTIIALYIQCFVDTNYVSEMYPFASCTNCGHHMAETIEFHENHLNMAKEVEFKIGGFGDGLGIPEIRRNENRWIANCEDIHLLLLTTGNAQQGNMVKMKLANFSEHPVQIVWMLRPSTMGMVRLQLTINCHQFRERYSHLAPEVENVGNTDNVNR